MLLGKHCLCYYHITTILVLVILAVTLKNYCPFYNVVGDLFLIIER